MKYMYFRGLSLFATSVAVFISSFKEKGRTHAAAILIFQMFLVGLMKLRLNYGHQSLAYRFGTKQSTALKYLKKWMDVFYV